MHCRTSSMAQLINKHKIPRLCLHERTRLLTAKPSIFFFFSAVCSMNLFGLASKLVELGTICFGKKDKSNEMYETEWDSE